LTFFLPTVTNLRPPQLTVTTTA